tara:strand:- start:243 stop:422 length:180 start_codon:yes stop_codon:yes gene_type:complete
MNKNNQYENDFIINQIIDKKKNNLFYEKIGKRNKKITKGLKFSNKKIMKQNKRNYYINK